MGRLHPLRALVLLGTAATLLASAQMAAAGGWVIERISVANDGLNEAPNGISGTNVVWTRRETGSPDWEIFFYGGTSAQLIATVPHNPTTRLSGNRVAWKAGGEFHLFESGTTIQVSDGPEFKQDHALSNAFLAYRVDPNSLTDRRIFAFDGNLPATEISLGGLNLEPRASDDLVAWAGDPNATPTGLDDEIFVYDGATTTQVSNLSGGTVSLGPAAISGTRVAWAEADGLPSREIALYDGAQTIRLTNDSVADGDPSVSASFVAWHAPPNVALYDGSTIITLSSSGGTVSRPLVSDEAVIWRTGTFCTETPENCKLFYYDISAEQTTQLKSNNNRLVPPKLSGRYVVWEEMDDLFQTVGLYAYDGEEVTLISTTGKAAHIDGPRIAYTDFVGPNVEVFVATHESAVVPTVEFVPALHERGLLALAVLLAGIAIVALRATMTRRAGSGDPP